jgi:putative transposase
MLEAANGFRRLKAHKQLPILRRARATHQAKHASSPHLEPQAKAA